MKNKFAPKQQARSIERAFCLENTYSSSISPEDIKFGRPTLAAYLFLRPGWDRSTARGELLLSLFPCPFSLSFPITKVNPPFVPPPPSETLHAINPIYDLLRISIRKSHGPNPKKDSGRGSFKAAQKFFFGGVPAKVTTHDNQLVNTINHR